MYTIKQSLINGEGVHLTQDVLAGTVIEQAIVSWVVTPFFGRWLNHSSNPTAFLRKRSDGDWFVVTKRDMLTGEELTLNYRNLPDYLLQYNVPGSDWVE